MSEPILSHFASFLSNWSLDHEPIPALLGLVPRKEGPADWEIGWIRGTDGVPVLLIGGHFQSLSEHGQRTFTHLAINQLLLGHLEKDFGWNTDPNQISAYLWQAYLYLPEPLQNYWPDWSVLKTINQPAYSLKALLAILEKEAVLSQLPGFLALAKRLQLYWSYQPDPDPIQKISRQELLKKISQYSGTLPRNWGILLTENIKISIYIPWPQLLRNYLKRFLKTTLQTTTKRPSKRYGIAPGLRVHGRAKIGVVLDTSGSVPATTLKLFQKEIKKIADLGHIIEIVEADAKIQRQYRFQGNLPNKLYGGGGTNYDPAIQYLENKARVDLVIYCTDGLGPKPQTWKKVPLIWLLVNEVGKQAFLKRKLLDWPGKKVYVQK